MGRGYEGQQRWRVRWSLQSRKKCCLEHNSQVSPKVENEELGEIKESCVLWLLSMKWQYSWWCCWWVECQRSTVSGNRVCWGVLTVLLMSWESLEHIIWKSWWWSVIIFCVCACVRACRNVLTVLLISWVSREHISWNPCWLTVILWCMCSCVSACVRVCRNVLTVYVTICLRETVKQINRYWHHKEIMCTLILSITFALRLLES